MGILGYPNMDDNNRDGIFGDYSDVYSNYPEENSGAQVVNEDKQVGDNLQAEIEQPVQDSAIPPIAPQSERQANGRLMFYIVVLGLLLVGAAGMYLYKQKADVSATQDQSMGDYFYEQAANNSVEGSQDLATVEVDLVATEPASSPAVQENTVKASEEKTQNKSVKKADVKKEEFNGYLVYIASTDNEAAYKLFTENGYLLRNL